MSRTHVTRTSTVGGLTSYGEMLDPNRVEDILNKLDEHDGALDTVAPVSGVTGAAAVELVTSGALSLNARTSRLSITGAVAFTLANGTVDGQEKIIECHDAQTSPAGTLTVTTMDTAGGGANAVFVFTAASQKLILKWNTADAAWHIIEKTRAGRQAVVVGTTVLTGYSMAACYDLSVTGTVSSTTTKGIPNGQFPGERIYCDVTTATGTPVGNISITAKTTVGVAATSWAHIDGADTTLEGMWDGAAWQAVAFVAGSTAVATLS